MGQTNIIQYGRTEDKNRFIDLRAKGYSYAKIAKEIGVSKGTLTQWNEELKEEITRLKAIQLDELYSKFYMGKEARITQLGDTLARINTEIEQRDFTNIPLDKLLDYKIRLIKELKEEYLEPQGDITNTKLNAGNIVEEFISLLIRVRKGEVTKEQATRENYILANLVKAYETNAIEEKLDSIETIVKGRK